MKKIKVLVTETYEYTIPEELYNNLLEKYNVTSLYALNSSDKEIVEAYDVLEESNECKNIIRVDFVDED